VIKPRRPASARTHSTKFSAPPVVLTGCRSTDSAGVPGTQDFEASYWFKGPLELTATARLEPPVRQIELCERHAQTGISMIRHQVLRAARLDTDNDNVFMMPIVYRAFT
jgi:hypothetical protein